MDRPKIAIITDAVAVIFEANKASTTARQKGTPQTNVARQIAIYYRQVPGNYSLRAITEYFC